jgi:UDP-glucose 4-epimerase
VIYDNASRGHRRVADILKVDAVFADLNDRDILTGTLRDKKIDCLMHFAAFAYVGESVEKPLMYYANNVGTTINVLQCMADANVNRFVFSSTCAIFGDPERVPLTEDQRKAPVSPYGRSKLMVEQILADYLPANKNFSFAALRYFNASGCAADGTIGEDHDPETHLIPVTIEVVLGKRPYLQLFGTDYPTPDGTNVRDYIHIEDLADAHILAMEKLKPAESMYLNLGTGRGFSNREIIAAVEKVTGKNVPVKESPRRPGDAIALYADPSKAKKALGWEAKYKDPEAIIRTAWNWHSKHSDGYGD